MPHVVGSGEPTAGLEHLFEVWEITQDPGTPFETKVEALFELETEAFDLPYAFVSRTDAERDRQTIELAAGSHEQLQSGSTCPLSESYCRKTIAAPDGTFHVDDALAEGWDEDPAYERFELGTYVGARVEVDEETFGTFCFAGSDPREEPLTAEERRLVELLAMWAGSQLSAERPSGYQHDRGPEDVEELVRTVSHDLRGPLGVAEGRLKLLEESVQESLDRVHAAHRRMETIIEQLLVLARVDQPVTGPEPVELGACVSSAWEMVWAENARLERTFDAASILADADRLENLLENLFRNCVEHGSTSGRTEPDDGVEHGSTGRDVRSDDPNRSVTVEIGVTERGFYVADDGPGIPASERATVFEPGYSGTEDGTGFGLSIVERITDAHGWDVTVTESERGGVRFEFTGVEFVPA